MKSTIQNDYYTSYNPSISDTHHWRTASTSVPNLAKHLENSKSLKILDVGCGPGTITYDIYNDYGTMNEIYGVDTIEEMLENCRKEHCDGKSKQKNEKNNNTLQFMLGSAYDLPFEDDTFDIVFCSQVLLHLEHPAKAINEMKRVLKKNKSSGSSYLFTFEAIVRSLLVHPPEYEKPLDDYFMSQKSKYTKFDMGLQLKDVFYQSENALEPSRRSPPKSLKLDMFTWCISTAAERELFATMYSSRMADLSPQDIDMYKKAWKDWAANTASVLTLNHGVLICEY
jgi:ubiquinone/menaquinone biosynthesis C-methylase UbiE